MGGASESSFLARLLLINLSATQGELMTEVLGELSEWLPTLWKVGVEKGVEHALVHKGLKFCHSSHQKLGNTNSRCGCLSSFSIQTVGSYPCVSTLCRAEFSDIDSDFSERKIKDATGRVIYRSIGSMENTILWVWRDLLISSIVHTPSDTVAKKIVADMKKMKLTKEMLERFDDETLRAS